MQLPLPSAHRYHNLGLPLEVPLKTTDSKHAYNEDKGLGRYETSSYIDSRVLAKIQHIVRQGFVNPFLVRAAAKVSFYEPC